MLKQLRAFSNQAAGRVLCAGITAVVADNCWLWRRDRSLVAKLLAERTDPPALKCYPRVSVLVAAWNEERTIDAHIRSFLALTYPGIELVLCAGGDDTTIWRATSYRSERIVVIEQCAGEGKQRALARCMELATGDIIYLTDADCIYSNDALIRLLAPLVNEGEGAATGASRPLNEQCNRVLPLYLWASDVAVAARAPKYSAGILGRNAVVSRQALVYGGGLHFEAPTGTDYHLARRLIQRGIAIRYVGESVVPTAYPESPAVYRRKQSRWLKNILLYGPRYGAMRDVHNTARTVLVGAVMGLAPITATVLGWSVLSMWLVLVAHATGSKLRYLLFAARLHQRRPPLSAIFGLAPLTLIDFVVWASPIFDLLTERRRGRW